jgi:hypothetical protein
MVQLPLAAAFSSADDVSKEQKTDIFCDKSSTLFASRRRKLSRLLQVVLKANTCVRPAPSQAHHRCANEMTERKETPMTEKDKTIALAAQPSRRIEESIRQEVSGSSTY